MRLAKYPRRKVDARQVAQERELVYLIAPGGAPNYGDEYILRAWLRYLARTRPDAAVVVDCHTPGQAAILLSGCHPRALFVDTVWRICDQTSGLPPKEAIALAGEVVGNPGRMPKLVTGVELLARSDVVHLVGGGYINTVWSHHLALLATAAAAGVQSGGRVVATGLGLLPVGDDERLSLLRGLQTRFAIFDVRDALSYRAIAGSGGTISLTGDDAWLGLADADVYNTESEAARRPYVLCLQSDLMDDFGGGLGTDGLTKAITVLIEQWKITGEEVAAVEGIPGSDRVIFDRIAHLLPGAAFATFTDVWRHGLPARSGQTWVSTRFHPHLLAAATGASGLALAGRRDYYPIKHQSLIDSGSHWQLADSLDSLPSEPVRDGGFAPDDVHVLRRRKSTLAGQIYPAISSPSSPWFDRAKSVWMTKNTG